MDCERPDHDAPGIVCGHPLPCPWHTVIVDATSSPPTVTVPVVTTPLVGPVTLKRLKQIALAITDKDLSP